MRSRPVLAAVGALVVCVSPAFGDVLFVRASAAGGGDGRSWAGAVRSLRTALDMAAVDPSVDQVWVAAGRYTPASSDRAASFRMRSGLAVYGGFAGTETQLAQRSPAVNITTLSGDLRSDDGPGFAQRVENSRHVVTAADTIGARLDGFTISGGNADFPGEDLTGGGAAQVERAHMTIAGCTFRDNIAGGTAPDLGGFGGALLIRGGEVSVESCRFDANRGMNGGALGISGFEPGGGDIDTVVSLAGCDFVANFSPSQTGGAIWSATGDPLFGGVIGRITARRCRFEGNEAEYHGAWIDQNTPALLVEDCVFRGNRATVHGGAFSTSWTAGPESPMPATLRRCTFEANTITEGDGSAFFAQARSAVIEGCTIRGNFGKTAVRSGPVIGFSGGARSLTVINSLLHDNTGTAVFGFRNPAVTVISSTIARNVAGVSGGLAGGIESSAALLTVYNTILWDNRRAGIADQAAQFRSFDTTPRIEYCTVQGLTGSLGGIGNLGLDPLFAAPVAGDFRPRRGSPAIDAGSNTRAAAGIVKDVRGLPRFINDATAPDTGEGAGPIIDMGAYEGTLGADGAARRGPTGRIAESQSR
ncbi:MAG: right-handed parallel beta-helix repeat-containing protein [Phycisphaerales bacterium]|nr:right-handed parallel beta-helix repeat-containing protein [Phycisphaerales bacterium]